MPIKLRKVLKQEIKDILDQQAESVVEERIITQTLDDIAEWTGELIGKLTTLDVAERGEIESECFNQIYEGLIQETMDQLSKTKIKKLTK